VATRAHECPDAAPASPAGAARVTDAAGAPVCERCVLADTYLWRLRGLLGRRELPAGEGLLLRPCGSVHSWFLRFPIDVVLLDGDMNVLKVIAPLRPWRMAGARGARCVLELAAGQARARGIGPGDRLVVENGVRG